MTITATLILSTIISSVITIVVKVIWDWAANKGGKAEIEKLIKDRKIDINDLRVELKDEIEDKLNILIEIKSSLDDQRKDFSEFKNLILLEYVKKAEFEKVTERFFNLRDVVITNKNNIEMIKESSKQNLERMTNIENRILK